MSAQDQNRAEMLETFKSSTLKYGDDSSTSISEELGTDMSPMSALEELSLKIELCLKKQQQVRFISREISEIVKKSS